MTSRDVLLVLRTPPPYGGGEMVGRQLERCFAGRYAMLTFHRPGHARAKQGRISLANMTFGIRFIVHTWLRLLATRPRVLYVDIPKDPRSFLRNSAIVAAALALRVRVVGDLAGADFQFMQSGGAVSRYGRFLLLRLYAIRVLGNQIAETLGAHGLENAVVVSNGIDEPPGADGLRVLTDAPAFLYVGKLAEAKGVLTLLDFARALAAADAPGRVHLVGEWETPAFEQMVRKRIAADGLAERIHVHGLLVDDAKWAVFRLAHVLLHPTRWDGQPVTILEALAFGLPVVATRVGAIPDTVRSGVEGYLMTDDSAAELAAGVREITADSETYAAYSSRARKSFLERFTSARFAEEMAELFERAAKSSPGQVP